MLSLTKLCLRFLGTAIFVIAAMSTKLWAADVTLAWLASPGSGLVGYKVHYGNASRRYDTSIFAGNATTYTLTALRPGTYYIAVTAVSTSGKESGFSNEVSIAIPPDDTFTRIILSVVAENSVTIGWTTNKPTKGVIKYGKKVPDITRQIVALGKQAEADPKDPRPRFLRGVFYIIKRHYETAATDFTAAIDGGFPRALAWRALAFKGADDPARARLKARPYSRATSLTDLIRRNAPGGKMCLAINLSEKSMPSPLTLF
jgi:hypothetical protein